MFIIFFYGALKAHFFATLGRAQKTEHTLVQRSLVSMALSIMSIRAELWICLVLCWFKTLIHVGVFVPPSVSFTNVSISPQSFIVFDNASANSIPFCVFNGYATINLVK